MANLNPVEASIVNIRNTMPSIILTFHNCMRKYLPDILDNISSMLTNDIKLQTYLKYKAPNSIREFYKDGEIEFDYLKCVDPLNLVKLFTNFSDNDSKNTVEGTECNIFTLFFKDYFNTIKNNQSNYSNIKETCNIKARYSEEPEITSIRAPYLEEIDLSEMSSIGTRAAYYYEFNVPRMGVKTVKNYKITEFVQQKELDNDHCPITYCNDTPFEPNDKRINRLKVSEILVGQIDYQTLAVRIIRLYSDIYDQIIKNEEFAEIIKRINAFSDENGFDHFEKMKKRFYWSCFVLLSKILNSESVAKEAEYDTNTENVLPKGNPELIECLKNSIRMGLDSLINDCTISMSLTFLAKVGRTDMAYPYDINRDMLNGILDITLEDINYFNNKFDKSDIDKESELYNYMNPLNRKKSGTIVRKRMLDYVTLSWLAQKNYNKNFSGFQYLNHLYGSNSDYSRFNNNFEAGSNDEKGSVIYKFALRNLQEIYSNMTYTSNFTHNIVDMRNGQYVYKETIDLARTGIDLYIVDTDIKIFLNLGCSNKEKEAFLINGSNYDMNALKNHRALASIYKASVHVLFKLIYVLEGIKKYSEFTKSNNTPPEHIERYVKVKSQLKEIYDALKYFKGCYVTDVLGENHESLSFVACHTFPMLQYSLGAFISGKLVGVSRVSDNFTDKNNKSYISNDILAVLYTIKKLDEDKKIKITDGHDVFYMNQFKNIASVYATDSSHVNEISQEFDTDDDIVDTLKQFSKLDNPELRAIHRRLYESYENMKHGFDFEIKSQLFSAEVYDLLDKSIAYLDNNNRTMEGLALTSSIVTYANDIFNIDSERRSAEDIAKFNEKIEEFDKKLIKSIENIEEE